MKINLSTLLELAGFLCVLTGAFTVAWQLGVVVVGIMLLVAGWQVGGHEAVGAGAPRESDVVEP